MKTSPLFALIIVGITCCATAGPGGGGAASGGSASGSSTGTAASPTTPATDQGTTPAAPPNTPATTSQQLIQRNENMSAASNSAFSAAVTNQTGMNTNMQGTNNFAFRDRAVTPADQALLVTLRQELQVQLGQTLPTARIHFFIDNGVVTLLGLVPNATDNQRILLLAQQTAGVAQVIDRLHVGTPGQYQPYANRNRNNNNSQNNTTQINTTQTGTAANGNTQITGTGTTQTGTGGTQITGTGAAQTTGTGASTSDHAFSASDRQLLLQVQQQATQQTGLTQANGMQLPVHFSIQNGVVAITGQVASPQQKAMIAAAVQNVPGVVRVVNDMTVSAQSANGTTTQGATANSSLNNQLAPTSTGGQSNAVFQNPTNQSQ